MGTSPAIVYITEVARPDLRGSLISLAPTLASLGKNTNLFRISKAKFTHFPKKTLFSFVRMNVLATKYERHKIFTIQLMSFRSLKNEFLNKMLR